MKKLMNKKGFTLMEMLIVVAIIVILVAISIPVFSSQLTKAKTATDTANMRAARATAITEYLMAETDDAKPQVGDIYDAANGTFVDSFSGTAYGAVTEGSVIVIESISADGIPTLKWEVPGADDEK